MQKYLCVLPCDLLMNLIQSSPRVPDIRKHVLIGISFHHLRLHYLLLFLPRHLNVVVHIAAFVFDLRQIRADLPVVPVDHVFVLLPRLA